MSTIVGIGEFIWDIFPEGTEPGGAVANVVQHAHTMVENAVLVSRVGDKALEKEFLDLLQSEWVNLIECRHN